MSIFNADKANKSVKTEQQKRLERYEKFKQMYKDLRAKKVPESEVVLHMKDFQWLKRARNRPWWA